MLKFVLNFRTRGVRGFFVWRDYPTNLLLAICMHGPNFASEEVRECGGLYGGLMLSYVSLTVLHFVSDLHIVYKIIIHVD